MGRSESNSRGMKSHVFRDLAAGEYQRTRSRRNRANEKHCLVNVLASAEIVNLPPSVVLESLRLRGWQSFADAAAHAVKKARNSTPCRTDRLGMIGDGCESFAEIPRQLGPRGGSGKFAAQSRKKGRCRWRSHSSLAGSHLPCGPIDSLQIIPL